MRPAARLLLAALLYGSLVAVSAPPWGAAAFAADDAIKLDKLRAKLTTLSEKQSADVDRRGGLVKDLRGIERQVSAASAKLAEVTAEQAAEQKALDALNAERKRRMEALKRERGALAGQVKAAFVAGREERLKLLLNQQDPAVVGRMLAYYDRFNLARSQRIARVDAALAEIATVSRSIESKLAVLGGVKRARAAALEDLTALRTSRRALLAKLDADVAQRGRDIAKLTREQERLRALLEQIGDVFVDAPDGEAGRPFAQLRGRLPWPVRGRLLHRYGEQRPGGNLRWEGLLIESAAGGEVKSVAAGRVAFADWLPHYGLLVILEHGDGYLSLYGHNQTVYKQLGEWVQRGERIAASGDSGGQQRAALYFEVRKGKVPQDPRLWLARR
jgi:septal ring factor EnvC (AmiA/AmiB activator)